MADLPESLPPEAREAGALRLAELETGKYMASLIFGKSRDAAMHQYGPIIDAVYAAIIENL